MPKPGYKMTATGEIREESGVVNQRDERVERIFKELQDKGLIDKKIRLVVKNDRYLNFKSSLWRKRILYNPTFSKYLSDNGIRFALLHEMGHKKKIERMVIFLFLMIISLSIWLILLFLLLYPLIPTNSLYAFLSFEYWMIIGILVFSSLGMAFLFFVFAMYLHPWLSYDELYADKWAAKNLKKSYNMQCPSQVLSEFFEDSKHYQDELSKEEKKLSFRDCMRKAIGMMVDPHPPDEKRVEFIRKEVDGDCNA